MSITQNAKIINLEYIAPVWVKNINTITHSINPVLWTSTLLNSWKYPLLRMSEYVFEKKLMQKCSAIIAKRSVLYSFSAYTLRTPLRRKYAINNVKLMHNKSASIKSKCLTQLFFFTYIQWISPPIFYIASFVYYCLPFVVYL